MVTKTAYRYDEMGRLVKAYKPFNLNFFCIHNGVITKKGDERFTTSFHYDSVTGGLTSIDFPDGSKETFQLDENGLPLEICYSNGLVSKRSYDDRSRLIEISEAGKNIHYVYDERDRVTNIMTPFGEMIYSYDQNGNVLSKTDPLGLTSTFEYDENDFLVKVIDALGGESFYEYSASGGLTKIVLPNGSIREIGYDEFERPVALK
ncbi:RHS repeat protein [Candidatus Roizmanbacteria bacterium]|nr:RHS repeat protein [Candidatus Roizmanbacteria bacterium]